MVLKEELKNKIIKALNLEEVRPEDMMTVHLSLGRWPGARLYRCTGADCLAGERLWHQGEGIPRGRISLKIIEVMATFVEQNRTK
jgi:hypothetical protein